VPADDGDELRPGEDERDGGQVPVEEDLQGQGEGSQEVRLTFSGVLLAMMAMTSPIMAISIQFSGLAT
jgi:hypothetical protein